MFTKSLVYPVNYKQDPLRVGNLSIHAGVKDKLIPVTVNALYCVPRLFQALGVVVDNKIYKDVDLANLASIMSVSIVVDNGLNQFCYNNGQDKKYILRIDRTMDHAYQLEYYSNTGVDGLLDVSKLALAKKKKNNNVVILRENVKRPKVPKKLSIKMEKLKLAEDEIKLRIANKRMGATNVKNYVKKVSDHATSQGPVGTRLAPLLKQAIAPYSCEKLIHFPDGMSDNTNLHKAFTNLPLTGVIWGETSYLGLIHSGTFGSQYFTNTKQVSNKTVYQIANLGLNAPGQNQDLTDNFIESAVTPNSVQKFVGAAVNTTVTLNVPLHTGFDNAPESEFSTMLMPSEPYLDDGTLIINSSNLPVSTGSPNAAFPFGQNVALSNTDYITIVLNYRTLSANTSVSAIMTYGYGNTIGTFTFSTSTLAAGTGTSTLSTTAFTVAGTGPLDGCDRLYGIQLSFNNSTAEMGVNLSEITVSIIKEPGIIDTGGEADVNAWQPYSLWNGFPIPSFPELASIVEFGRAIGSSALYTDFSEVLTVSGLVSVATVKSGLPPAESGIYGNNTLANFPSLFNGSERKGAYASPIRIIDINSAAFDNVDDTWRGKQPYTVIMGKCATTAANAFQVRMQICDIFEFKVGSNQFLRQDSCDPDPAVVDAFKRGFKDKLIVCENPLHFGMIKDFISSALNMGKQIMPYASALANVSGNKTAMGVASAASQIMAGL